MYGLLIEVGDVNMSGNLVPLTIPLLEGVAVVLRFRLRFGFYDVDGSQEHE